MPALLEDRLYRHVMKSFRPPPSLVPSDGMTTPLFVFGDEYGTMPVKDNDGPFLAAVVAMRSRQWVLRSEGGGDVCSMPR